MKCPKCDGETRVLKTRAFFEVERQRICKKCFYKFETLETLKKTKMGDGLDKIGSGLKR